MLGRFIPAHAGNTHGACRCLCDAPVHPRARGEHTVATSVTAIGYGSSPRTRGTLRSPHPLLQAQRFIPAHAGNTRSTGIMSCTGTVHPRARGEHGDPEKAYRKASGSSPRTRGTLFVGLPPPAPARFIPAHAGNTPSLDHRARRGPVHPRARGEHILHRCPRRLCAGSSPRTRGTHLHTGPWTR